MEISHGVCAETSGYPSIHYQLVRHSGEQFHGVASGKSQPQVPVLINTKRRIEPPNRVESVTAQQDSGEGKVTAVPQHRQQSRWRLETAGRFRVVKKNNAPAGVN